MRKTLLWNSMGLLCAGGVAASSAHAALLTFSVQLGNVIIADNSFLDRNTEIGSIVFDSSQWLTPPAGYWARGRVDAGSEVNTGAFIIGDVRIESNSAAGAADLMSFVITFDPFRGGDATEWANGRFEDVIPSGVPLINRAGFTAAGQFDGIAMPPMVVGPIVNQFPIVPFDVGAGEYIGVVGGRLSLNTNWYLGGWDVVDWPLGVNVVPGPSSLVLISLGVMAFGKRRSRKLAT